jgi:hypothetical protein
MPARYRFIPWVRLGASPTKVDSLGAGVPARGTTPVRLRVNDRRDVNVTARLHGPGDVVSIDTRMVVRTDPPHLASEFEPNYFPMIEFDRPDLPWLFTPATGNTRGRLRPWLALVTVRRQPGVAITVEGSSRRPVLHIDPPARPVAELPDLVDSWAWAHAQVGDPGTGTSLDQQLAAESTQNLSRVVCPRRLAPNTSYVACLVPAFDIGRRAGLGLEITSDHERELTPAWNVTGPNPPGSVTLPVYYHWEFSTGDAGDFETLVRRLQGRRAPDGLGVRPLVARSLGFGLPDLGELTIGGALRAVGPAARPPIPAAFEGALQKVLNLPADRLAESGRDPLVGPPIYGSRHAAQHKVEPGTAANRPWLAALNLDPRLRAVAGLGVLVVQDQQEQLMASAWQQLGQAGLERREIRQPAFATAVLGRVHTRLAALEPDQLLAATAPLHARVRIASPAALGGGTTLHQQIVTSRTPTMVTSTAFRKAVRPHGPLARRPPAMASASTALRFATHVAGAPTPIFMRVPRPDMVTPQIVTTQLGRLTLGSAPDGARKGALFRTAVNALNAYVNRFSGIKQPADTRNAVSPGSLRSSLLTQLDPTRTTAASTTRAATAVAGASAVEALPGPVFPQPMYETLGDLDPQLLLPNCDRVEPDSVVPLASDPRFIESFMVGLNHELGRELLWREYPSDERSTSFRVFWAPASADPKAADQMPPLHMWTATSTLGSHFMAGSDGNLVVLVRGELFDRYPGTTVYLTRSMQPAQAGSERVYPLFRGRLGADMTFLGFGLSAAQLGAARWFVVFEQQPTEPRFGLDAATETGRKLTDLASWNDLSWGDVATNDADLAAMTHVRLAGRLGQHRIGAIQWASNSGHMAAITLQRAFRIALPLSDLMST